MSGGKAEAGRGKRQDDEFYQGFACALGTLARDYDRPSMAVHIMRSNGVTLSDLERAGAMDFDLKPLRKEWRGR